MQRAMSEQERAFNEAVSARVRAEMRRTGVKSVELAEAMGVCYNQFYNYENGIARWPIWRLHRAAKRLGVQIQYLFPTSF
jgi:hypothetical protein